MQPFGQLPTEWAKKSRLRSEFAGGGAPSGHEPRSPLVTWAGRSAVAGGVAMVLGGLSSWNLFRVGTYHFYGKGGIAGGTHLALVIFGVASIVVGASVLRPGTPQARRARLSGTLLVNGSLGLFWLSRYADGTMAQLERWVVDSYSGTIAASTGAQLDTVKASLQASIDRGDVAFSLRGGFFMALVGTIVVLASGVMLFVHTRRHHPLWRARARRKPDQGLTDPLA